MRRLGIIALVAFAASVAPQVRAEDEAAIKVVQAGIKAHGGEEALKKTCVCEYKMKGTLTVSGIDHEYTGVMKYQLPSQFKTTVEIATLGKRLSIVVLANGDSFKRTINGIEQELDDDVKQSFRQILLLENVARLYPLLDQKKFTIKSGKDAKIGDFDCSTVVVESEKSQAITLFFDRKTALLRASLKKGLSPEGESVAIETLVTEYKDRDGVKYPYKMTIKQDGKNFEKTTVTDLKFLPMFDEKVFAIGAVDDVAVVGLRDAIESVKVGDDKKARDILDKTIATVGSDKKVRTEDEISLLYFLRGSLQLRLGEPAKAMADLRHAVKLEPDHDKYLNAVAWLAATSPDEKLRDGKYAVACATKSVKAVKNIEGEFLIPLRDYTLITYLDTLAAAHAEMGEFKEAVRAQNDALKIVSGFDRESLGIAAEVAGKKPADLKKEFGAMKERLALYRDMIPYRAK